MQRLQNLKAQTDTKLTSYHRQKTKLRGRSDFQAFSQQLSTRKLCVSAQTWARRIQRASHARAGRRRTGAHSRPHRLQLPSRRLPCPRLHSSAGRDLDSDTGEPSTAGDSSIQTRLKRRATATAGDRFPSGLWSRLQAEKVCAGLWRMGLEQAEAGLCSQSPRGDKPGS